MDCGLPAMRQSSKLSRRRKKRELPLLVQNLDLHEVGELASECLNALVEPLKIALDLRPQQRLHAVVGELRFEFADGARWIAEEAGEGRADAGLRPRAFEQDAVEDFDLIEMVALRLEELPPLVDSGLHDRVVIVGKRDLRPVRFEEILVDMKAWAKGFERGFQPLDCILLFRVVKAFVVDAGNTAAPCRDRRSW